MKDADETKDRVAAIEPWLLTSRDAAAALSISKQQLFRLTGDGSLPCIRLNRRTVRYSIDALKKWIEDQQRTPIACVV